MAASKSQGSYFGLFLLGATVFAGGIAYIAGAPGKLMLMLGAAAVLASLVGFARIKHLEGETPVLPGPEAMKWVGAGVALLGWVVTIGGLRLTDSNGGRIFVALLGIGVSLFGIFYVLPAAFNKTAFWKKPASTSVRKSFSSVEGGVEPGFGTAPSAMESMR
jgi:hypothetical protein